MTFSFQSYGELTGLQTTLVLEIPRRERNCLREKLQLQKRRLRRKRPSKRWKKCNPVRKKKRQL
jgi:hypothetical protein